MKENDENQLRFNFQNDGGINKPKEKIPIVPIKIKKGYAFIKEIPLEWAKAAGRLRGRASYVGERLWFLAGVNRQRTFEFSISKITDNGISRSTASRGLKSLQNSGLVFVEPGPGKRGIVTILDVPKEAK